MRKTLARLLCVPLLLLAFGFSFPASAQTEGAAAINFVVLGDSIAEGKSALTGGGYAERIARDRGYVPQNFGKGGDTSHSLLCKVTEDEAIRVI